MSTKAEKVARDAEEEGRKLLYTTDMRLMPFLWKDDRTTTRQLRHLLANHNPDTRTAVPKSDLRGFEWYYYQHLLDHGAEVFSGHDRPVIDAVFADGQLVTLDREGQIRRSDLATHVEDASSRRDLPGGSGIQKIRLSPNSRLAALADAKKASVFYTATGKLQFELDHHGSSKFRVLAGR